MYRYRFSILFLRNDLSIFHATMIKRSCLVQLDMNGLNIWKIVFFARIKPTKTGCCCWYDRVRARLPAIAYVYGLGNDDNHFFQSNLASF